VHLLADENVPVPSIRLLRAAGYVVDAMIELAPGTADPEVLSHARQHGQILITFDRDFGELVYHRGSAVPAGIIYLRLSPADPEAAGRVLVNLFALEELQFEGHFTVVDTDRIRQRPLLKQE
jgi:predicted nuclease of predicted toxin-antitoxin system